MGDGGEEVVERIMYFFMLLLLCIELGNVVYIVANVDQFNR